MKRKLIAFAAIALVLILPTLVSAKGTMKTPPHASGTITAWNEAMKEVTVKDSAGQEHMFTWNEKTNVMGTPKVGEHVRVAFTKDKDGKMWATEIHVGVPSGDKASPKK
jgi:uncharacterized protein YpmB